MGKRKRNKQELSQTPNSGASALKSKVPAPSDGAPTEADIQATFRTLSAL
eukprot:CAMPEP_0118947716 /NCGR_PEP_ID=MMETSP1169-20130426/46539_1 /TAXON_ID=36882 /ORGANISM="Pyramimonas obovata, Strain CCMP722" /LENGTH=49 /DNA_ID= /DNA_START= /DNA_END= /DNA_ORIENTATION=